MSTAHNERPGYGVMYYEYDRRKENWPDYKGFLILNHDYKKGEKLKLGLWIKQTKHDKPLFSLREDELQKLRQLENQEGKEVHQGYARVQHRKYDDDDNSVPF